MWGTKIAQKKLEGPKLHNLKTWGTKIAFKPKNKKEILVEW